MYITLVTIGEPKLNFAKEGFSEYIKRLGGFHRVEVLHIRDNPKAEIKLEEVMEKCDVNILLDENGAQYDSPTFAKWLVGFDERGITNLQLIIGGPDGHSDHIKSLTKHHWSLSKLTLPHDLAMLFCAEALYRASTINAGHPYHRG